MKLELLDRRRSTLQPDSSSVLILRTSLIKLNLSSYGLRNSNFLLNSFVIIVFMIENIFSCISVKFGVILILDRIRLDFSCSIVPFYNSRISSFHFFLTLFHSTFFSLVLCFEDPNIRINSLFFFSLLNIN